METMTSEQFRQLIAKSPTCKPSKLSLKPAPMSEDKVQEKVAAYVAKNYPAVIFDGNSKNIKLEVWQGAAMKRMGKRRGYPDMFIASAKRGYHGLYIELKREGERLKKLDGDWVNEHVENQAEVHEGLRKAGYWADFVIGYEAAKKLIDWYLGE